MDNYSFGLCLLCGNWAVLKNGICLTCVNNQDNQKFGADIFNNLFNNVFTQKEKDEDLNG